MDKHRDHKKKEVRKEYLNGKIMIAIGIVILLCFGAFLYLPKLKTSSDNEEIMDLLQLQYVSHSIVNAEVLSKNCAAIRVGHCELIGGKFGDNCWKTQKVNIDYDVTNLKGSLSAWICEATDVSSSKSAGTSKFVKSASAENIYSLQFLIDLTNANNFKICCYEESNMQQKTCLNDILIDSIC